MKNGMLTILEALVAPGLPTQILLISLLSYLLYLVLSKFLI